MIHRINDTIKMGQTTSTTISPQQTRTNIARKWAESNPLPQPTSLKPLNAESWEWFLHHPEFEGKVYVVNRLRSHADDEPVTITSANNTHAIQIRNGHIGCTLLENDPPVYQMIYIGLVNTMTFDRTRDHQLIVRFMEPTDTAPVISMFPNGNEVEEQLCRVVNVVIWLSSDRYDEPNYWIPVTDDVIHRIGRHTAKWLIFPTPDPIEVQDEDQDPTQDQRHLVGTRHDLMMKVLIIWIIGSVGLFSYGVYSVYSVYQKLNGPGL